MVHALQTDLDLELVSEELRSEELKNRRTELSVNGIPFPFWNSSVLSLWDRHIRPLGVRYVGVHSVARAAAYPRVCVSSHSLGTD